MHPERVLEVEILQTLRNQGVPSVDEAQAVVLETDGTFSVVKVNSGRARSSLRNVVGL